MRIGLANPASEYCVAHGGALEVVETPAGQMGLCRFPDGTYCEEFPYLNGECQPSGAQKGVGWKIFVAGAACGIAGFFIGRSM